MSHRYLVLIAAILPTLPGCKIELFVPQDGSVATSSGSYSCSAGETCVIDVVDLFFDETFVPHPRLGHTFSHWVKKPLGLCGGVTKPCRLFTSFFEGNDVLMTVLQSDIVFFLEPVFVADAGDTVLNGLTSQFLPIALTIQEDVVTHVEFTYQQLGEIPPDPECRHRISADLSTPIDTDGTFAVDISVPAQSSGAGKLQVVTFDGQLTGSIGSSEVTGHWDFTEMEILCKKSTGEILRNFCGEDFFPCIDQIDIQFLLLKTE